MFEIELVSVLALIVLTITSVQLTRYFMKCAIRRCESKVSMSGKVIVITGANTGIGYYAARDLAARGARVILACRDERRGTIARDKIVTETGNKGVVLKKLDLSSLDSVRKFAEDLKGEQIDVLVNNAGVSGYGDRYTPDGIVEGMQINHFGPFLLTLLLLPSLKKTRGRIVNVSSLCHFRGNVKFKHLNEAGYYSGNLTYANSKLCTLLFTVELSRRLKDHGVTVNAVHPGVILTNIANGSSLRARILFRIWCWICCRTAEEGAQTVIYLSVADECAHVSGKYFVDCDQAFVLWKVHNEMLAKDLWDFSEKLVKYEKNNSEISI